MRVTELINGRTQNTTVNSATGTPLSGNKKGRFDYETTILKYP